MPRAPRVLDVAGQRERGRRAARVGAGVGREALDHHPQPRVARCARGRARAASTTAAPRASASGDGRGSPGRGTRGGHGAGPASTASDARHIPAHVARKRVPLRAGAGRQASSEARERSGSADRSKPAAVGEAVAGHRLDRQQLELVGERRAGVGEQRLEHPRHRQQRRPGVPREAAARDAPSLAAAARRRPRARRPRGRPPRAGSRRRARRPRRRRRLSRAIAATAPGRRTRPSRPRPRRPPAAAATAPRWRTSRPTQVHAYSASASSSARAGRVAVERRPDREDAERR